MSGRGRMTRDLWFGHQFPFPNQAGAVPSGARVRRKAVYSSATATAHSASARDRSGGDGGAVLLT